MNMFCILADDGVHYHDELQSIWFEEEKAEFKAIKLNNRKDKPPNREYYVMSFVVRE